MIPTIHDGKKRSGLIKSIAPILEESLDGLLKSLREADDEEKSEESELDDGYDPVAAEAGDSSDEPVK